MPSFEYQPTTMTVANTILIHGLSGGPVSFALPHTPGLGVEVDLSAICAPTQEDA
jgi:galactonate dehydratase